MASISLPRCCTHCSHVKERRGFGGRKSNAEELRERGGDRAHINGAERMRGGDARANHKKRSVHRGKIGPVTVRTFGFAGGDEIAGDAIAGEKTGAQGHQKSGVGKASARVKLGFGNDAVDDAFLLEEAGYKVIVVPGELSNVKVTFAEDKERVSSWLRQRYPPF